MKEQEIRMLENELLLRKDEVNKLVNISNIRFSSDESEYDFLQRIDIIIERVEDFLRSYDEGRYHPVDKSLVLPKALEIYTSYVLYLFIYILNKHVNTIKTCNRRIISAASPMSKHRSLNELKEEEESFLKTLKDLSFLLNDSKADLVEKKQGGPADDMKNFFAVYLQKAKELVTKYSLYSTVEVIARTGFIGDVSEKKVNESQKRIKDLLDCFKEYMDNINKTTIKQIDVLINYFEFLKKATSNSKPKQ